MATTIRARIDARGEVSFAKFLFLSSWFAKLMEANFSCFAKIIWMSSWFAKLLELLLESYFLRLNFNLQNSFRLFLQTRPRLRSSQTARQLHFPCFPKLPAGRVVPHARTGRAPRSSDPAVPTAQRFCSSSYTTTRPDRSMFRDVDG
jgi:hypothetical protein